MNAPAIGVSAAIATHISLSTLRFIEVAHILVKSKANAHWGAAKLFIDSDLHRGVIAIMKEELVEFRQRLWGSGKVL